MITLNKFHYHTLSQLSAIANYKTLISAINVGKSNHTRLGIHQVNNYCRDLSYSYCFIKTYHLYQLRDSPYKNGMAWNTEINRFKPYLLQRTNWDLFKHVIHLDMVKPDLFHV